MLLFHTTFLISVLKNVFQFNPRIKQNLNLFAPSRPIFKSVRKPQLDLCYTYRSLENYSNSQKVMGKFCVVRFQEKLFLLPFFDFFNKRQGYWTLYRQGKQI